MTTGNRTTDLRTFVATSCSSSTKVGLYATKQWDGVDYPKTPPPEKRTAPANPHYRREYYYDAKRASLRYRLVQVQRLRTWYVRTAPRRVYDDAEHPYWSLGNRFFDPVMKWRPSPAFSWNTGAVCYACGFGPMEPAAIWTANDDLLLAKKIRNRVAGNDFDASAFLGEGVPQALRMIGNAAHRIARGLTYARHGNLYAAARALMGPRFRGWSKTSPAARTWLELQYGWIPLLDDAKEGAEFLAHHFNVPVQTSFTVTRRRTGAKPVMNNGYGVFRNGGYSHSKRVKVILKEKSTTALAGLQNPSTLVWELLPYSFVVDWFIPIGNWLQAKQLESGIKATYVTSEFKKWWVKDGIRDGTWNFDCHQFWYEGWRLTRTVSDKLDIPFPSFKTLGKAISRMHTANAVALLCSKDRKLIDAMLR